MICKVWRHSDSHTKALARWCALAPEKSLRGCELTIAALGATAGSRSSAMSEGPSMVLRCIMQADAG